MPFPSHALISALIWSAVLHGETAVVVVVCTVRTAGAATNVVLADPLVVTAAANVERTKHINSAIYVILILSPLIVFTAYCLPLFIYLLL
jgi:hypothetical protein